MALITLQNVYLSYSRVILDDVSLQIHAGERISLLGRNGAGKSTFVKLLQNRISPDSGNISFNKGLRCAALDQEVPELEGTIGDIVSSGVSFDSETAIDKVLSMCILDPAMQFKTLSAGMKRRTLIAKALAASPDILILDEPTNHLDIETIEWLERIILRLRCTVFFVTHDRTFLSNIAQRIIELDRGHLYDWNCDYRTFLERKEAFLTAEAHRNEQFDKKLAKEEAWLRRGIKARRTRNEGRVRALKTMREELSERRELENSVKIESNQAAVSGKMVSEADNICFAYDEKPIISGFSMRILRGDHIAIVGNNGCGKSTLVKLLLGKLSPVSGTLRNGTNLETAYFDQMREGLDGLKTVRQSVTDGGEMITINGHSRHIVGYLQDFLFSADRINDKVSVLSGGEKNRLMLARLFARPANVLVFDEPTNDLDIETIELLEDLVSDYDGTVIIVSHDRNFIENTCERILCFEDNNIAEHSSLDLLKNAGGFRSRKEKDNRPEDQRIQSGRIKKQNSVKLSYREKNELNEIPAAIERIELRKEEITQKLADPALYQNSPEQVPHLKEELHTCETDLESLFSRWEELEQLRISSGQ